jgi:predicted regulator of Ras-like GTPase activity (Roadblock/LC7/MglB family)
LKEPKEDRRFQAAVEYLTDYTGVIGAAIADSEGLVIACGPSDLPDSEMYAALGPEIFVTANRIIERLVDPGCEYLALKTAEKWLTIATTLGFYLIVLADRKADELLNVRIQRALEMISTYIKEKYPAEIYTKRPQKIKRVEAMEASNV